MCVFFRGRHFSFSPERERNGKCASCPFLRRGEISFDCASAPRNSSGSLFFSPPLTAYSFFLFLLAASLLRFFLSFSTHWRRQRERNRSALVSLQKGTERETGYAMTKFFFTHTQLHMWEYNASYRAAGEQRQQGDFFEGVRQEENCHAQLQFSSPFFFLIYRGFLFSCCSTFDWSKGRDICSWLLHCSDLAQEGKFFKRAEYLIVLL